LTWISLGALSYAIGGIPTAYLVTRYMMGRDIRSLGDFNSGAANVFRNVGPRAGLAVGAIDIVKGAVAVVVVRVLTDNTGMEMMAGIVALAGHNWPVHMKFRGGRGAATAVGVLIAMLPVIALPIGALCLVVLYFNKRAIIPLAIFLVAIPVLAWPSGHSVAVAIYALAVPLMVGLSHVVSTRLLPTTATGDAGEVPLPQE
jgi:glycerol-3-phosphate acyltransferase PlsY